ncbi:MAG: hypothetical protein Q4C82_10370 [Eubacteriales bacterium]|nr:hypothetical protein [Eubacteriales bacterium]
MKKELDYFSIDGACGGSQDWMSNYLMKFGGCAALTACDTCIFMALRGGRKELYPFDVQRLTREDYDRFAMRMKPYLRPRIGGVDRLSLYMEGFGAYLKDAGADDIRMEGLPGEETAEAAREQVRLQIDRGLPVPCLLLKHKNPSYEDYVWHWFLLTGYEEYEGSFLVKAATYGAGRWLDLEELWDTGSRKKGGLILYRVGAGG